MSITPLISKASATRFMMPKAVRAVDALESGEVRAAPTWLASSVWSRSTFRIDRSSPNCHAVHGIQAAAPCLASGTPSITPTTNTKTDFQEPTMMDYPKPPFPQQQQPMPGYTRKMDPIPDHGETSYKSSGRLAGKKAIITGGDSGIGRAVAIAYAREGADLLISYLSEDDDANETRKLVEQTGQKAILVRGDLQVAAHCRAIVTKAVSELGAIDILVNNAAHQASFKDIQDIDDEEWDLTFRVNVHAMFYLIKATVPHMRAGGSIINTASINSDVPNPTLLAYATTKGAIQNFTAGLAQLLAAKGIRANAVAPGPIWTPLIPSTMPDEAVVNFGKQVPMGRPGQPAELATTFVMLADPLSSYVSGATIAVTGGKPIL
jgi:NAD(P)-dependent dehydrogenase (short-subunit alcohol dehydrogenase family)